MGIENIDALIQDSVQESHDETDVPAALKRDTQDGAGPQTEDQLPPSDFEEVQE
jgi:hypothetical protein